MSDIYLLTFFSLLLGRGLIRIRWLVVGPGAHCVYVCMALRALFVHIVIIVVVFLIIVVVKNLATHQWHWTLHKDLLILGIG